MTYQHLTVQMFENAKINGGMIDQTIFKTAQKYGFNSLYFEEISSDIIDDYVQYVRPLLNSQCDYLLLNRNGLQFQKLTDLLIVLVFQAIGKYTSDKVQEDHRDREREQVGFRRATSRV